jgi:hypothetical protein
MSHSSNKSTTATVRTIVTVIVTASANVLKAATELKIGTVTSIVILTVTVT